MRHRTLTLRLIVASAIWIVGTLCAAGLLLLLLFQDHIERRFDAALADHLQELAVRYTEQGHILAAYNAGASRVERWAKRTGVDDPEVFAERIPFVETRGYVRIISRNQELYRSLYEWPEGSS